MVSILTEGSQSTLNHQSQVESSWWNRVPLGQRKEKKA